MSRIDDIKKALDSARAIYDALRRHIRPGVSERGIYELVGRIAAEHCAGRSHEFIGDFISGERTAQIEGAPTDRLMKPGDPFILDLSLRYESGWCDVCRTFFLGQPTAEMKKAYEAVLGCQKIGEQTVRAGVSAQSVKASMEEYLQKRGYGGHMPHHAGHAVGEQPYQKPAFDEGCDMTVPDGEIITLEPGLYFAGQWGVRVENDYLVGESGLVNLFDYPTDMDYFIIRNWEATTA